MDQNARPQVSFVVPCYNERANIAAAVAEIGLAARGAELATYEILVVDDCSTDDTGMIVAELARHNSHVRLITNPRNLGFGGAYKAGLKHAEGTYVIMVPGDNAHPHAGIVPILQKAGEADIIVPYVMNPAARSLGRRLASRAFTALMNGLFQLKVPYFNGLVLHNTRLLRTIEIETNGFAYQAEALVKLIWGGASFLAVPVEIAERGNGRTSAFRPKNVYRVGKTIFDLVCGIYFRPRRARKRPAGVADDVSDLA